MVMGRYIYAYIVYGYIDILFLWFFSPTFTSLKHHQLMGCKRPGISV